MSVVSTRENVGQNGDTCLQKEKKRRADDGDEWNAWVASRNGVRGDLPG